MVLKLDLLQVHKGFQAHLHCSAVMQLQSGERDVTLLKQFSLRIGVRVAYTGKLQKRLSRTLNIW